MIFTNDSVFSIVFFARYLYIKHALGMSNIDGKYEMWMARMESVDGVNGGIDSSKAPENESEPPAEAATSSDQAASQLPPKKRSRTSETQKSHVEEMLIIQQGILDTMKTMVREQTEQTRALHRIATALEWWFLNNSGDCSQSISYTQM